MKLGAQLYSVRKILTNEEECLATMKKLKEIGYENVQLSGAAALTPELWRRISVESGLPFTGTHSSFNRIIEDTEALIAEHKIMECPVIGIGSMPKEYRATAQGVSEFCDLLEEPVKMIRAAGLAFSYHNHNFEFVIPEGGDELMYDTLLRRGADWNFILDTYWVEKAGYSALEYMKKVGGARLVDIHYKDMSKDGEKTICACGNGCIDFKAVTALCRELGVKNVLVEQDNAAEFGDELEQMEISFKHLRPIIAKEG